MPNLTDDPASHRNGGRSGELKSPSSNRVVDSGPVRSAVILGGIYSNYLALEEALRTAAEIGDPVFALGDFGAFGPFPDRTVELLREQGVPAIQGNYEEALSSGAEDCHCGYTDPRDNRYARISYEYTRTNTAPEHLIWMGTLPLGIRMNLAGRPALLCHGSPRKINEFLWESATPDAFILRMLDTFETDLVICTHTGLHWRRWIAPGRGVINVGCLGRPANDGRTCVWMARIHDTRGEPDVQFIPVQYDHERLAREMESESLPTEFADTIRSGWWTTCLEILPAKERARGRF